MRNVVQTVDRALSVLLAFEREGEQLGVTEIAGRLGVHKSTASRLAATLEARGFLERSERDAFRLGPELARLGRLAVGGRDLVELARPAMDRLAAATGETVNLAIADQGEVVNVAQVDGRHIVGVGSWTGRRTPPHCTANGKVLLAWAAGPAPDRLDAFTEHTITSETELGAELVRVRARGYATAVGELEEGLHAVAAPVVGPDGRCVAALSVSGPSYRMPVPRLAELGADCVAAGSSVGRLVDGSARAA
jgi:DNA-binding IclR family transcriptional regulator